MNDWLTLVDHVGGITTPPNLCELAVADTAPRDTKGDGRVTLLDIVQCLRFSLGWDLPGMGGGPTEPFFPSAQTGLGARQLSISGQLERGRDSSISIHLDGAGDEYATAFTLEFDPGQLQLKSVRFAANQYALTNTVHLGKLGIVFLAANTSPLAAGRQSIAEVTFYTKTWTNASTQLRFTDSVTGREISSLDATPLATSYMDAAIPFTGGPRLTVTQRMAESLGVVLAGVAGGEYVIERSSDLTQWTWVSNVASTSSITEMSLPVVFDGQPRFYRAIPAP